MSLREGALRPRAFWFGSFLDLHGLHVDPLTLLCSNLVTLVDWAECGLGKKKKKKKQQLLLGVNGVHSTSSHSFEERGYENTNVIIMRDFNTFIKIKTGIYEFLLRAFKLKASLSYLKCCIGNNCWSFSLVRHLYTVTITTIFFFWQTLIIRYWKKHRTRFLIMK